MPSSSQNDLNDDRTTSFHPSDPPADDGSSGKSYQTIFVEALTGFVESFSGGSLSDSREPSKTDNERRHDRDRLNDHERWSSNERRNDHERRNHSQKRNENIRWNDDHRPSSSRSRYERSSRDTRTSHHLSRDDLREIAVTTLNILDEGEYFPPGQDGPYDLGIKIRWTEDNTRYYGPDAGVGGEILESEFIRINEEGGDEGEDKKQDGQNKDLKTRAQPTNNTSSLHGEKHLEDNQPKTAASEAKKQPQPTSIYIGEYSTLVGARKVHFGLANSDLYANKKIGVLNFASAKKPGGGFINGSQAQEESIARASTLYASLLTPSASQFYTHYHQDPTYAYYTHSMVYSPAVVLLRDDSGEWRSPVEVDVLTSAAVNAGEIRRELEGGERLRRERVEMEFWKKRGEERKKENEKAMAEKQKLMEERVRREREEMEFWKKRGEERKEDEKAMAEKQKLMEEKAKARKEKKEIARLKKERADLAKLKKGMAESKDDNETKTDEGKVTHDRRAKDSVSENEDSSAGQEKPDAEVENGKGKRRQVRAVTPEESPEENATDSPVSESSSVGQFKAAEEHAEPKGTVTQDNQPNPETPPKVTQEPTSSSAIAHPLSSQTQRSQAPNEDLAYRRAVAEAENRIYQTMYDRISRILHLFQLHQTPHLVLGSFGTGVFQNRVDLIASIFADLLVKPGGRFKNVFQTVVFAILGKETVRVFSQVFSKVEAQGKRKFESHVFIDQDWSDGDVKEREDVRIRRIRRWEARRNVLMKAAQDAADAASFAADTNDPFSLDGADYPPSFDAAQAGMVLDPISFAATRDEADHLTSFNTAHADASPASAVPYKVDALSHPSFRAGRTSAASYPSFGATQAGAVPYSMSFNAAQGDAGAARSQAAFAGQNSPFNAADGIPKDEKMILTNSDEQVNLVAEKALTTSQHMVVDEGKDTEMVETKSLPRKVRNSRSRSGGDGNVEMQ